MAALCNWKQIGSLRDVVQAKQVGLGRDLPVQHIVGLELEVE
jgi:hypothetical protein